MLASLLVNEKKIICALATAWPMAIHFFFLVVPSDTPERLARMSAVRVVSDET